MSYANFGPTYQVESITNALAGALPIPTTAANTALAVVNLISDAGGAEIPLVLSPGVWILRGKCFFEPLAAGAMGVQYAQAYIENLTSGDIVASSTALAGAAFAAGQDNVVVAMNLDVIFTVNVATSFVLRFRSNGITTQAGKMGVVGTARVSSLRATRISA
jgi:hypothetical protein